MALRQCCGIDHIAAETYGPQWRQVPDFVYKSPHAMILLYCVIIDHIAAEMYGPMQNHLLHVSLPFAPRHDFAPMLVLVNVPHRRMTLSDAKCLNVFAHRLMP